MMFYPPMPNRPPKWKFWIARIFGKKHKSGIITYYWFRNKMWITDMRVYSNEPIKTFEFSSQWDPAKWENN